MTAIIHEGKSYSYEVVSDTISKIAPALEKTSIDNTVALMLSDPFEMALCVLAGFHTKLKIYLLHPLSPPSRVEDLQKKHIPVIKQLSDLPKMSKSLLQSENYNCSLIFPTSNTTGNTTHWVEIPAEYLIKKSEMLLDDLQIKKTDCTYFISPVCFIQSCWTLLVHLMAGGTVWIDNFSIKNMKAALSSGKITTFITVPSIARTLASDIIDIGNLRTLVLGGDFADKELVDALASKWPSLYFANVYGCTETSAADLILKPTRLADDKEACYTLGTPSRYSTVNVLDGETRNVVAHGTIGSIWIKSAFICKHYLGIDTPLVDEYNGFCTNDLGYIDEKGRFCFWGRSAAIIKCNGCKISALEIESVLNQYDGITEAIVLGEQHNIYGQIPVCYLYCEKAVQKQQIISHLSRYIEKYKIPKDFYIVESIPKTVSGKSRRNAEALKKSVIGELA